VLVWAALAGLLIAKAPWWTWWIAAPVGASVAAQGWRGFARFRARVWLMALVLVPIGAGVPYLLLRWHPALGGVGLESVSLVVRAAIAHAAALASWLMLVDAATDHSAPAVTPA
ncbi:MAG: hypothetical protein ACRD96_05755, partial [Bryobacteraceae bacterium]